MSITKSGSFSFSRSIKDTAKSLGQSCVGIATNRGTLSSNYVFKVVPNDTADFLFCLAMRAFNSPDTPIDKLAEQTIEEHRGILARRVDRTQQEKPQ